MFVTLESQPQIILFYYFFGGCGFKIVTGQCGARQGIYSAARLGQFSLNPSATNMKWIYPAFTFNNGLMPQSGSAWHNATVKRKEAGATRNCHIKPILEKWIRQICLFSELCSVMCPWRCYTCSDWNSSKMTDCTACAFFFFFSLPLHLQHGSLCVKKRSTEHNFQEIILLLLQTFVFRRGFKVQMYTFFDFPPLCFLWLSASRPRPKRRGGKKKSSHCKTCIFRALAVFSFLF